MAVMLCDENGKKRERHLIPSSHDRGPLARNTKRTATTTRTRYFHSDRDRTAPTQQFDSPSTWRSMKSVSLSRPALLSDLPNGARRNCFEGKSLHEGQEDGLGRFNLSRSTHAY